MGIEPVAVQAEHVLAENQPEPSQERGMTEEPCPSIDSPTTPYGLAQQGEHVILVVSGAAALCRRWVPASCETHADYGQPLLAQVVPQSNGKSPFRQARPRCVQYRQLGVTCRRVGSRIPGVSNPKGLVWLATHQVSEGGRRWGEQWSYNRSFAGTQNI
jgi:hypothetical protein